VFVELEDVPVDGFVRVSSWIDDDFTMDDAGVRLVGRRSRRKFSLGDRLTVRLARVDLAARELELALVVPRSASGRGRAGAPRGGRRAKKPRDPAAPRNARSGGKAKGKGKGRGR
jgi:ribonuclease R